MTGPSRTLAEGRAIVRGLRSLRDRAPADLAARTLSAIGDAPDYAVVPGPFGPMLVAWGARGLLAIEPYRDPEAFERELSERLGRPVRRVEPAPARLVRSLARWLEGGRTTLEVDLSALTEFEQAVLRTTARIPRGEVRPYAWIAREIGRPKAVRAVGSALATNPVPLVIPCHRVVRSDGLIGNYGWGSDRKRALLALEGLDADELERDARQGRRYVGSDTTNIFCFPSCRNARRIRPEHRRPFATAAEGVAAGYRPCRTCRPAAVSTVAA